jgi:hypothetical protein
MRRRRCAAFHGYESLGIGVFLAALPVIGGVILSHRLYLRHIEDTELAQKQRVDAAEREAAEAARHLEELQKSENRFRRPSRTPRSAWRSSRTTARCCRQTPRCARSSARSDELLGSDLGAFVHRDDHALLAGELAQLIAGNDRDLLGRDSLHPARSRTSSRLHSTHRPSSPSPTRTPPASSSRCRT